VVNGRLELTCKAFLELSQSFLLQVTLLRSSDATCKKEVPSYKATGVNTHIFFGVRSKSASTSVLGIATLGGACKPSPTYDHWHCAMMEYEESDIAFARV